MIEAIAPAPIDKPDTVVPDAAPLIHLAQAGLLHLLLRNGGETASVEWLAEMQPAPL